MRGTMKNGAVNTDITHNRLETVPKWIHRSGLQIGYKEISAILQYNYVAESYSDALNTKTPSANGASGIVPSYHIFDINLAYRFNNNLNSRTRRLELRWQRVCGIDWYKNLIFSTKN